jgi:hypothetical protein
MRISLSKHVDYQEQLFCTAGEPNTSILPTSFSQQPAFPHSQLFRKAGQKKAEPNTPLGLRPESAKPAQQNHLRVSCGRAAIAQGAIL